MTQQNDSAAPRSPTPLRGGPEPRRPAPRLIQIDIARGAALLGMVIFHAMRDLELFGLVPRGTTLHGAWNLFGIAVAGGFLFLSGISLFLAHGAGLRGRAFLRRLATLILAAGLVTLATYLAFPSRFVYFGILHAIAAMSLLALPFVFLPAWMSLLAAGAILLAARAAPPVFDAPWLVWTGLGATWRPALDFLPLVPWGAPVLLGVGVARALQLDRRRGMIAPSRALRWLAWPGRHSLAIYLLHQPVLIALLWLGLRIARLETSG